MGQSIRQGRLVSMATCALCDCKLSTLTKDKRNRTDPAAYFLSTHKSCLCPVSAGVFRNVHSRHSTRRSAGALILLFFLLQFSRVLFLWLVHESKMVRAPQPERPCNCSAQISGQEALLTLRLSRDVMLKLTLLGSFLTVLEELRLLCHPQG